jgi:dTDP-4-amino-4,6-dideoxygalactose transaminase
MTPIPFIDLATQRDRVRPAVEARLGRNMDQGAFIMGPDVAELESALGAFTGARETVTCGSGTDALVMPLMAWGIGAGDAVFVPSFTFAATAEVVALAHAEPVFVDVDADSYNMDVQSLERAIAMVKSEGRLTPKAIIPVDLFGLAADYTAIAKIAARENLFIIEDAAQSIGGRAGNRMCGAFGNVGATSFYPAKPLGCYGDGGAMFTNDAELAERLRSFAFHGKGQTQYDNVHVGLNSRLDTIQAAILLEKLSILEDEMEARDRIAKRYIEGLKGAVKVPVVPADHRSAWAQFAIETPGRDALKASLGEQGIPSVIYYPKPLHHQDAYSRFPVAPGGLPVSEGLPERILCLPMHPYLSDADQDRIIEAIRKFAESDAAKAA